MVSDQARDGHVETEKQTQQSSWPGMHTQVPWRHTAVKGSLQIWISWLCTGFDRDTQRDTGKDTDMPRQEKWEEREPGTESGNLTEDRCSEAREDGLCLHYTEAFSTADGILGSQPYCCVSQSISLTDRLHPPMQNPQEVRAWKAFRKPLPNVLF